MPGLKISASYGFYPHKFGFCGPAEKLSKDILSNYISGKKYSEQEIRKILKGFKGAFPYYQLIAKCNKIKDPFDEKVVRAYWLGNKFLENVPIESLKKMIAREFSKPGLLSLKTAVKKAERIPLASKPHHSFHIFAIGSVTGRIRLEDKLLDICRVGWGKVIKFEKEKIIIEYQPILKKDNKYFFGEPIKKPVFWNKILIPKIKIGDTVSTHWNHAIQIIGKSDLFQLKKYTQNTIDSINNEI